MFGESNGRRAVVSSHRSGGVPHRGCDEYTREAVPRGAVPSGTCCTARGGESPSRAVGEVLIEVSAVAVLEVWGSQADHPLPPVGVPVDF